jgi:hypothetical protein
MSVARQGSGSSPSAEIALRRRPFGAKGTGRESAGRRKASASLNGTPWARANARRHLRHFTGASHVYDSRSERVHAHRRPARHVELRTPRTAGHDHGGNAERREY